MASLSAILKRAHICLACVAAWLLLLPNIAAASAQSDWLEVRKQMLALSGPIPLPESFKKGELLLLGEVHGMQHGQILDLALLQAAHRDAGVRTYLGEFDAAQADAFNRLLETGETAAMDAVFASWRRRGLQWANADFRTKLLRISEWNRSLPAAERIRFVGADEVQDQPAFCRWLAGRLPKDSRRRALAVLAEDPKRCHEGLALARLAAVTPRSGLDAVLRDALASLANQVRFSDREDRIAANARRQLRSIRTPAYGLWGLGHVVKAPVNGSRPMALQLSAQGVEVRSIAILNLDGRMMIPFQEQNSTIGWNVLAYTLDSDDSALVNGIELFAPHARSPLTLFRLRAPGSPFQGSDILTKVGGRMGKMQPFSIDASRAHQGFWADEIIISRGSPPTDPVSESIR